MPKSKDAWDEIAEDKKQKEDAKIVDVKPEEVNIIDVAPTKSADQVAKQIAASKPTPNLPISTGLFVPTVTAEDAKAWSAKLQEMKINLLDTKLDILKIQNKPFIKKSGWRKLAMAFCVIDEIIMEQRVDEGHGDYLWKMWVRATSPNGRSTMAVGMCSTKEFNFKRKEHDVYAFAHTRAKNRAISDCLGSGEVSAEEVSAKDETDETSSS